MREETAGLKALHATTASTHSASGQGHATLTANGAAALAQHTAARSEQPQGTVLRPVAQTARSAQSTLLQPLPVPQQRRSLSRLAEGNPTSTLDVKALCLVQLDPREDGQLSEEELRRSKEERRLMLLNQRRCEAAAPLLSGGHQWRCIYLLERDRPRQTSAEQQTRAVEPHWQGVFAMAASLRGRDCDAAVFLASAVVAHATPVALVRHFSSQVSPDASAAHDAHFFVTSDQADALVRRTAHLFHICRTGSACWRMTQTAHQHHALTRRPPPRSLQPS